MPRVLLAQADAQVGKVHRRTHFKGAVFSGPHGSAKGSSKGAAICPKGNLMRATSLMRRRLRDWGTSRTVRKCMSDNMAKYARSGGQERTHTHTHTHTHTPTFMGIWLNLFYS